MAERKQWTVRKDNSCPWELPEGALRGPGFPVPRPCDVVRDKLTLERVRIGAEVFDLALLACGTDATNARRCELTVEATGRFSHVTLCLRVPVAHMEHPEWVSSCVRYALVLIDRGETLRTFEFE